MNSLNRNIVSEINLLKTKYPILAITGPRQSGKTTFLRTFFSDYRYLTLENPDTRRYALNDPNGFLKEYDNKVIFDEVQRVPELFSYLQTSVDESKIMGQYILSGSQNFQLINNISQSLAGRVALFKLFPFDFNELKSAQLLPKDYSQLIYTGFYPAIYDRGISPTTYYTNYLQTYIERDLLELTHIKNLKLFRTFLLICAGRAGQLLNLNNIANECGISQPTAKSWLSILESSYIIYLLQPYFKNMNKRIVKSPKLYFYDTGLLSYLVGIRNPSKISSHPFKGALFENMIVSEYVKRNYHLGLHKDYWFWRDSQGHEIDLLSVEEDGFKLFEVKASSTIQTDFFKELDYFENLSGDQTRLKTLIYAGDANQTRTKYAVTAWANI